MTDIDVISVEDTLGQERMAALNRLVPDLTKLDTFVRDADITDIHMLPMSARDVERFDLYRQSHLDEAWARVADGKSGKFLYVDDVADNVDIHNVLEAAIYPELHTRAISWWLTHAWRFGELANASIESLKAWNLNVAAVCSRALIEEVGCLLNESKAIATGWAKAKSLEGIDDVEDVRTRAARVENVRNSLDRPFKEFAFASRNLSDAPDIVSAISVQTYVNKLARDTGGDYVEQYAWLSNSAHPAVGSRIAYSGPLRKHVTGAVIRRRFTRRPRSVDGNSQGAGYLVAQYAADSTVDVINFGLPLIWRSLELVDDFGLTTCAATLTNHKYWRNLMPVERNAQCPCGCGKFKRSRHQWRKPLPTSWE